MEEYINVVCNNVREEVSKIRLQAYFNWQDWFSTQKESGIDNVPYHPTIQCPSNEGSLKCNVDVEFNSERDTTDR